MKDVANKSITWVCMPCAKERWDKKPVNPEAIPQLHYHKCTACGQKRMVTHASYFRPKTNNHSGVENE